MPITERKVYKYGPIRPGSWGVSMPKDARVVHFGAVGDDLFIWAEVEGEPSETRIFVVYPTGVPVAGRYVGTAFMMDGALVWHLYEQ